MNSVRFGLTVVLMLVAGFWAPARASLIFSATADAWAASNPGFITDTFSSVADGNYVNGFLSTTGATVTNPYAFDSFVNGVSNGSGSGPSAGLNVGSNALGGYLAGASPVVSYESYSTYSDGPLYYSCEFGCGDSGADSESEYVSSLVINAPRGGASGIAGEIEQLNSYLATPRAFFLTVVQADGMVSSESVWNAPGQLTFFGFTSPDDPITAVEITAELSPQISEYSYETPGGALYSTTTSEDYTDSALGQLDLTPTPEPETTALVIAGLGFILAARLFPGFNSFPRAEISARR